MELSASSPHVWRFGLFEVNERSGELRRDGVPVRLREQSSRILVDLLEHPGAVVTREDLRRLLWPSGTFVDFEHSLNTAMMKLREALGDSAEKPLYIETIAKRGYRFIAPLASATEEEAVEAGSRKAADGAGGRGAEDFGRLGPDPSPHLDAAPRLAVLPFADISQQGGEHYGDGLTSQLIVGLGRTYKRVHVISPVSSLYFAGSTKSIPEIAADLRADYLLVGSVWHVPAKVRISVQLMRAVDQCCVWSDSYTREDTNIFEVQDEIIRSIAGALLQSVPEPIAPGDKLTTTPANYATYLKARSLFSQFRQSSLQAAAELFERMIAEDPQFAPAYAALAHSLSAAAVYGGLPPRVYYERIERLAHHALDLCGEVAEAHSALAWSRALQCDSDYGESEFLKAIEINPSFPLPYLGYAAVLSRRGRHGEAIEASKLACELDPLSPIAHVMLSQRLHAAGNVEEAIGNARRALGIDAGFGPAHQSLAMIYEGSGSGKEAIEAARAAVQHHPDTLLHRCCLAWVLADEGKGDEAAGLLHQLLAARAGNWIPATWIALVFDGMGKREEAWAWMTTAMQELCPWRMLIPGVVRFRSLENDNRFTGLLRNGGPADSVKKGSAKGLRE